MAGDSDSLERTYACADGSPFPVRFVAPGDAAGRWVLDLEHTPAAMSPLADAVSRIGRRGAEQAYEESGLRMPSSWREPPSANGFLYFPADELPAEETAALIEGCRRLVERDGSSLAVWLEHSRPRAQAACTWLQTAPDDTPLAELAELADYALQQTMVAGMVVGGDLRAATSLCRELVGDDAERVAHDLTQGYENETLLADAELWRIARLGDGSDAAEAALVDFLATYGLQSTSWTIDSPSLLERDGDVRRQLRILARDDADDPRSSVARAAERRRTVVADLEALVADDDDRRAALHRHVERLSWYVAVREDRALWQLIAVGSLRAAVLRHGARLVDAGVLDKADDVRYLTVEEAERPSGDLRTAVARRRREHDRWRGVTPPVAVGDLAAPASEDANEESNDRANGSRTLRGVAAGRGRVTAPARVVHDLADADRLEHGDVLVCRMTSPPWTPLFALASAIVADSGDVLSHVAIAAREYGLPCVVGTVTATSSIPDGAVVTVDGDAGTVEISEHSATQ